MTTVEWIVLIVVAWLLLDALLLLFWRGWR